MGSLYVITQSGSPMLVSSLHFLHHYPVWVSCVISQSGFPVLLLTNLDPVSLPSLGTLCHYLIWVPCVVTQFAFPMSLSNLCYYPVLYYYPVCISCAIILSGSTVFSQGFPVLLPNLNPLSHCPICMLFGITQSRSSVKIQPRFLVSLTNPGHL